MTVAELYVLLHEYMTCEPSVQPIIRQILDEEAATAGFDGLFQGASEK